MRQLVNLVLLLPLLTGSTLASELPDHQAAIQGDASAQYNLGFIYFNAVGADQDYEEAAHWYTLAAMQDHTKAQYVLGMLYTAGWGVERSHEKAAHWYTLAALQGHAKAQYELGRMHLHEFC